MNAPQPHDMDSPAAAVITPLLRTVLICDIVESTALVERLGDVRAVALLQRHDQLMRQALELCHGRLIDKADGMLALFERPIQALDFALRYQRGLRELGAVEGLDLKARVGIHVGDVMTWPNSPQDVLAGAKPFEVEGLAKPVAARLMNLALPGQILMSGMAQNLCHRAAGELGAAGTQLRWLLHGRYNFKGVPAPMLVHEVGEPGLSPLRAPESGAKAWRELPVWRRPPMLAIELIAVAAIGIGLFWSTLRSPPAIAFAERDWVVVADLQNRTSETIFDESLDTALRVGLEQSRHINVVSELQIDRALERMQRQSQAVDRQLATELALREGAKAVILPTVAQVGGLVRVSLEVIDPNSGVTVYSESADGKDAGEVLPALDLAMTRVRGQLGETLGSIEKTSKPLELVTTDNLEALRAYSLGIKARMESRLDDAWALFEQAVELDPEFAMAYLRMASIRLASNDGAEVPHYIDLAVQHRAHMSDREALFLDAAEATLDDPERAIQKFKLLAAMYPDEHRAYYNFAYYAHNDAQRYREALEFITPALAIQYAGRANAQYLEGHIRLSLNDYEGALKAFERADSLGLRGLKRQFAEAHAAQRNFRAAEQMLGMQSSTGMAGADIEQRLAEISFQVDQGHWEQGMAASREVEAAASKAGLLAKWTFEGIGLSLRSYAPDAAFAADLEAYMERQGARLASANVLERRHLVFEVLAGGWMAAHAGHPTLARRALDLVGEQSGSAYPANVDMAAIVASELDLLEGKPKDAADRLQRRVDGSRELYFTHAVLMRAHAAAGDYEAALREADWLVASRGLAYGEFNSVHLLQPANVIESNLALESGAKYARQLRRDDAASSRRKAFLAAWPEGDNLPATIRRNERR